MVTGGNPTFTTPVTALDLVGTAGSGTFGTLTLTDSIRITGGALNLSGGTISGGVLQFDACRQPGGGGGQQSACLRWRGAAAKQQGNNADTRQVAGVWQAKHGRVT